MNRFAHGLRKKDRKSVFFKNLYKLVLAVAKRAIKSLLLGLLGSLGGLTATDGLLAESLLDDTDGNSLAHVTDGEATERGVGGEDLDNHGLLGDKLNHGGITGLNAGGLFLSGLTGTLVDLGADLGELAGNVSGMAIKDGSVAVLDLSGMVKDDNLGNEHLVILGGVVLGVGSDVSALDILDGQVLDVETNIVSGLSLVDHLVMHLDGLDLGGHVHGAESDNHAGLKETGLDATDGDSANTTNLVDILEGKAEGLVGGTLGGRDLVESLEEEGTLVPGHVVGPVDHVITNPSRDGNELNLGGEVADLLEVKRKLGLDLVVAGLGVVDGITIHLVDGNDHLLDTHSLGEESVLTGLSVLGETGLELTNAGGDHEDGGISLGGTSDHVLDEIAMTGGINNGEDALGGLELPESDINGDTTLTLSLEFVKNPSVLEGSLTHLEGFLLELLDGTLIDTTALVDQVTGGGRFS